MKRKIVHLVTSKSGFTLIEVMASIVLLALIVGPFLTMFVQSSKTNQITNKVDDATFVANSEMEFFYNQSTSSSISQISTNPGLVTGYTPTVQNCSSTGSLCYTKTNGTHYVFVQLTPKQTPLEDVTVKVYKTAAMNQLQAQMETVYSWKN
ncbi:prepilin-type N-terminal cleavage/methylation domain-containing protein [Pullulanibacillus sp. KACC 23026]|uniref:type IV pilus modification PilV family protein n=1 Tax=Pullulanibacillus sp. KACC 23026 TaxID=3028315 RepID=UPI0023B165B1|nr:prepilin-type N-terminal cleavage/methylation domain-containing protein [Pullulanibacillus sp. KACC 23026]WEG11458.1 prepilin-type N-terminal cleavage/methylation domain-containing protein [Pullulanibacillus sp. KACC 23026]